MSRWVESYETSEFHAKWTGFKEKVSSLSTEEIADSATLIEISRLRKVMSFIESYLKLIDPEINKINILNEPLAHLNNAISEFNAFATNRNIVHLQRANSHVDNCAIHLKNANILLPKISSRSVSSMLGEYSRTLGEALLEINLEEVKNSVHQIKQLEKELFDDEGSIENKIKSIFTEINDIYSKINSFYNETLIDDGSYTSTKTEIITAKKSILEDINSMKESIIESANQLDELEKFYVKVYGRFDEKKEKRIDGLKHELEKRFEDLSGFEKQQHTKINELILRIEGLLPSATSAGLATAYYEERKKFEWPIKLWNISFVASLVGITIFSFISLGNVDTVEELGKSLLHSLPVTAPLIWLALYASKRRSENQRLEQEYAHKEALAKSYSGYKQQIESLDEEGASLLIKLLDSSIETISYNASNVLDKKHGDGTVLNEIVTNVRNMTKLFEEQKK